MAQANSKKKKPKKTPAAPIHPWRACPSGEHLVRTHPLRIAPTEKDPEGKTTTRHFHCAANPSGKDQLFPLEINEIANTHFKNLAGKPCPLPLVSDSGNQYDELIAGWVQYWNDILKPKATLESNLVKALIASESGFKPKSLARKTDPASARGLMQITDASRKILADEHGELKDHYVTATRIELNDPNINICAGVRWLFQKQTLATSHLLHEATWDEAVLSYKNLLHLPASQPERVKEMKIFNDFLERLRACKS